jgi:DNA modification methylase
VLARHIEVWPVTRLVPYTRNSRTHSKEQVHQIAASILTFGFTQPILVNESDSGILAGHGRLAAALELGMEEVPVIPVDHLTDEQQRAYIIADNKLSDNAGWDEELLAAELARLSGNGFDMALTGFSDEEMRLLLPDDEEDEDEDDPPVMAPPANPLTRAGDLWLIGPHRLICGDCRDAGVVERLLEGRRVAVAITSPPYASQRAYDPASGFKPLAADEYVEWYRSVAANIEHALASDGSYFLNIKEHADDGERSLYVKDLVLAHKREWGWRFVDEFCWRKTSDGVPGGWGNRFKNAWEPVFHFCRQPQIKFRPDAVSHVSENCFDYSPLNPKSTTGSGLLGKGSRGSAVDQGVNWVAWRKTHQNAHPITGRYRGLTRPSNVIETMIESGQGSHAAPFPRKLVEFFVKAFSDHSDVIYDPFLGSGTTLVAADELLRIGVGCEISPAYCDVILDRVSSWSGLAPILAGTRQPIEDVAAERGVPVPMRQAA